MFSHGASAERSIRCMLLSIVVAEIEDTHVFANLFIAILKSRHSNSVAVEPGIIQYHPLNMLQSKQFHLA